MQEIEMHDYGEYHEPPDSGVALWAGVALAALLIIGGFLYFRT
jgi:hypothetical protein